MAGNGKDKMKNRAENEGFGLVRFFMVLSSISPLFLIWAIRGCSLIADSVLILSCSLLVIVPNLVLFGRLRIAKNHKDTKPIKIGSYADHRDHLLVYLFTMLLPFFTAEVDNWRDFSAIIVALMLIVFIFWHLNLHYMNIFFAFKGYRIYTIYPPKEDNLHSGKNSFVLVTKRTSLNSMDTLIGTRLSNSVIWEE